MVLITIKSYFDALKNSNSSGQGSFNVTGTT